MSCGGGHLGYPIGMKKVLYKMYVFCSDMKFKMVATGGLSLTLDPMGKMFQNASSLKPLILWPVVAAILDFRSA
jgi:hypothetical protein